MNTHQQGQVDYLDVVYSSQKKPPTDYPRQMIAHLVKMFGLKSGQTILEPGCGQGNFLRWFREHGLSIEGCDLSPKAGGEIKGLEIKRWNADIDALPYGDECFDAIYSKSFVEHLHNADHFFREAMRVLKPGGKLISLTPDWEVNYRTFYDDPTHCRPFTKVGLETTYLMNGFQQCKVVKFRQLPIVWKFPALNILCASIAPFVPVRTKRKFFRWSRELMLIGYGEKPRI